jgi:hypothetical protein
LWSTYVEEIVQFTRSNVIERAHAAAAQAQSSRDPTARAGVDVLLAQLRVVLAHARVARSRQERAPSDLKRDGGGDRRVPHPRRLPRFGPPSSTISLWPGGYGKPRRRRGTHRRRARRAAVPRGRSLAARDRRAALLSLDTVETNTRELYRNLDVTSRADVVARPPALGLRDLSESPG